MRKSRERKNLRHTHFREDNLPLFPECVRGEDGKIHGASESVEVIDAEGAYLLPGFVDTHVHGGGGFDFCDLTAEAFSEVVRVHAENGTTSICPTAVSSGLDILDRMFDVYHSLQKESFPSTLIGLHLEGPFLSPKQSGAQNKSRLAPPTKENVDRLAKSGGSVIRRIGIAPELGRRILRRGRVLGYGCACLDSSQRRTLRDCRRRLFVTAFVTLRTFTAQLRGRIR